MLQKSHVKDWKKKDKKWRDDLTRSGFIVSMKERYRVCERGIPERLPGTCTRMLSYFIKTRMTTWYTDS